MKSKLFKVLGVATTLAILVSTLAAPALLAVTQPTVALSDNVISRASGYTIGFSIAQELAATNTITITLPAGTIVSATPTATLAASPGWVGSPPIWTNATTAAYTVTGSATARTVTFTLGAGDVIGATASVFINISAGITNPPTAGDYTLSVATTKEAAATSVTYTIVNPTVLPLPGLIKVYNSANVLLAQFQGNDQLAAALAFVATGTNNTLELGPGLYNESATLSVSAAAHEGLTIKASGAKADTVVPATWTVGAKGVKFTGITFRSTSADPVAAFTVTGDAVTFDGCDFVKSGTGTTLERFIQYSNTTSPGTGTITNCSFDTTLGAVADLAVYATTAGLTVSKNTFKLDPRADYLAMDAGVRSAANVTISENTFTGSTNFGIGVQVFAGKATVTKNTFSGNFYALYMAGGDAAFTGNTVDACGFAMGTSLYPAFSIGAVTNSAVITGNKISNSKDYIASIAAGAAGKTFFVLNELTGNAKGFNNADAVAVAAHHNWWGAATGPAAGANSANVTASPYLGAAPSNSSFALNVASVDTKSTAGVVVTFPAAVSNIGIANYSANPGVTAPASDLKVVKYFEVFATGTGTAQVLFYGSINAYSAVYQYDSFSGAWVRVANQVANTGAGAVVTNLTIADLSGTPFVLVEEPPEAPGGGTAAAWMPALGAVDVPVDTTFTWPAVPGAVSYTFELAEETGQTDKFYLKDEVGSAAVNAYKLIDDLKYDTQYWWRVQSINSLGVKSAWTTSFFTTEKEPEEAPPPIVVEEQQPPVITLEIPPSTIQKVEPIPSYLLWLVIGVGAVLVIVVIVLIVRTRRIS